LLIWSPWAKKGYVDHNQAQLASILAFIEANFGLPSLTSLNPRAQDGRVTNNLMADFDFTTSQAEVRRSLSKQRAAPPAEQEVPAASVRWLRAHPDAFDGDDT
jgi:phospholipase C